MYRNEKLLSFLQHKFTRNGISSKWYFWNIILVNVEILLILNEIVLSCENSLIYRNFRLNFE